MSGGKGAESRYHSKARRVARLAAEGMTTKQIAALVGVLTPQVKTMRELGERLLSVDEVKLQQEGKV